MKTVFKYPLRSQGINIVQMPFGAKVLCVHDQAGVVCLWAHVDIVDAATFQVNDAAVVQNREFFVMGTGWPMPLGEFEYVGTAFVGRLVWHVWEAK